LLTACTATGDRRLGDICARDDECASGRCDELVCKAASPLGPSESCGHPMQCRSERCTDGVCVQGIREIGTSCSDSLQCRSGQCIASRCAAGGDAGADAVVADAGAEGGPGPDAGQVWGWPRRFGSSEGDTVHDLAVDGEGNLYLTGSSGGDLDLGGGHALALASRCTFFASLTREGAPRWVKGLEGTTDTSLAVDATGNSVVVGVMTRAGVDLGGGPLPHNGAEEVFVAAFDNAGAHRWSRSFGGTGGDFAKGVGLDSGGRVYVGGHFRSATVDFGGGVRSIHPDTPPGSVMPHDVYLAAFTADGQYRWDKTFGSQWDEHGADLVVSAGDAVTITGFHNGELDFGGGPMPWGGSFDIFIASFDANGGHRWSAGFGATESDFGTELATDAAGHVYLGGSFAGPSLNLGGVDLINAATPTSIRYLASFSENGAHRWSKGLGGVAQSVWVRDLAVDRRGNLSIAGTYEGATDVGGGFLPQGGGQDALVFNLSPTLAHRWSRGYGGQGTESAREVAVAPTGEVYAAGSFADAVDFDGTELTSAGSSDIFIVRLAP
jgi:hypothetical protein